MAQKINWDRDILPWVQRCLEQFGEFGVQPTLRGIFYWLVGRNIIPNTRQVYKSLSRAMVRWRKQGVFPFDVLKEGEKKREVIGKYGINHNLWEEKLEWYEDDLKETLANLQGDDIEKIIDEIADRILPSTPDFFVEKWCNQRSIVTIWLEKSAQADNVANFVGEWQIPVRVNVGYASWTWIYLGVSDIKKLLDRGFESVIILYLGDWDPSGVDIERFLKEAMDFFKVPEEKVIFKRVAVTPEQIKKFNLPPRPEDSDTIEKLAKDPRSKKFFQINIPDFYKLPLKERIRIIQEKLSDKFVVELDAFVSLAPQEFKEILNEEIRRWWDESVYKELVKRKEELEEKVSKLRLKYREFVKQRLKQIISLS